MCASLYKYIGVCVYICIYTCIAVRAGGQRGCQPSADAGGPRAAGRGNAGRSAGSAGPPAAPETRSPGGDVSGFPSDRRAGASQSPAPVRCSRTWEGDRPAIPCLLLSFRPLCSTFPPDPWLGLLFFFSLVAILFFNAAHLTGPRLLSSVAPAPPNSVI